MDGAALQEGVSARQRGSAITVTATLAKPDELVHSKKHTNMIFMRCSTCRMNIYIDCACTPSLFPLKNATHVHV